MSRIAWSLVYECTVVIRPRLTPKLSSMTFAMGARQLVVHEPFEMMLWFFGSYLSSLTPSTKVPSWPLAGALMMTFLAPAVDVGNRLVLVGEEPGALENDVDAERLPRELFGVFDGEDLDVFAADHDRAVFRRDLCGLEGAVNAVVLQQVGEGLRDR